LNAQQREQRVGVFVDVQNLYHAAKNIYGGKVNFSELLKTAVAGRKLVRAFAYVIRPEATEDYPFFDILKSIGFDVRMKDLQVFYGGAKKGDWDVGIAMDAIRMASKLDTIVLASGDGDFRSLLEYLRSMGCRTEVIAFGKNTSQKLADEADTFTDMDKNPRRFMIHERKRSAPAARAEPGQAGRAEQGSAAQ
jgi:uncharacterized LabA/DUF88 family protein